MVKRAVIQERIEKLNSYIEILKSLSQYPFSRFASEPFLHGSAERYLHLSIECVLDIGNHIISASNFRKPESYQDVFLILGENKILPEAFAKQLAPMASFRNILVHDYLKLDLKKVYAFLNERLPDFRRYVRCILKLL